MSTFTTTQSTVRFTDTDGDVSFTATRPAVTFTAAYQSVTGGGGGASDLDDLTDVTITAAALGDGLRHNGTAWVDAPMSARWTVDVIGAFGPGFDELVPLGVFGALSWGDDYYFYQTPSGESVAAQAAEGTTIGCASYLLGAVDSYASDLDQEGIWTLTGGVWVRNATQPLPGEVVGQDSGAADWQVGNAYIKCDDGHIEQANLRYVRLLIAQQTIIETYTTTATVDATTSGSKTGFGRCDATAGAFTVNLPSATLTNRGRSTLFVKTDNSVNVVSIDADGAETINGSTSAITLTTQWDWVRLTSDGTGWVATRGGAGGGTVDVVSNVAQDRILGRTSSGSGDSEELTAASVRTLLGVQAADRAPITTRSSDRYGAGYATTTGAGSPLVPYEASTAPSTTAVAAGALYYWAFSGLAEQAFTTLIFEVTATALTAGQGVTIGMWERAADNGPGASLWSETVTTGTSTGLFFTSVTQTRPTTGYIGFLNPSGNDGAVTVRMAQPVGDTSFLLGSTVGQRHALVVTGQASWPADMSAYALWNTAGHTFFPAAPIILAGA